MSQKLVNFGDVNRKRDAFFKILPVPFEMTTSYKSGTKKGPEKILEASTYMELFDEEFKFEPYREGIYTYIPMDFEGLSIEEGISKIKERIFEIIDNNSFPIFIGGEHSITFPIVDAFVEKFGRNFTVIQFDAHSDLRESYEGTIYSHASVMRRVVNLVDVVQCGIRSMCVEEYEVLGNLNSKVLFIKDYFGNREGYLKAILENSGENIYLTIDVDALDPSVMPATGTPEPGGFSYWELLDLIEPIFREKNVIGCDVVEFMPIGNLHFCEFTIAKLIYKIMAYKLRYRKTYKI